MFPLRDDQPSRTRPVITFALIGFNALVFAYQLGLDEHGVLDLLARCALIPERLAWALQAGNAAAFAEAATTLVTSQFLHGGLLHLILNLWALWIFGDNVEDRLGPLRYLVFYVACGVAAGVVQALSYPHSEIPTVGASGAIAGVMGAYIVLYPRARVLTVVPILFWPIFLNLPAVVFLGLWFAIQLFSGASQLAGAASGAASGGVAWWAHVGGFLAGLALLPLLVKRRRRPAPDYV